MHKQSLARCYLHLWWYLDIVRLIVTRFSGRMEFKWIFYFCSTWQYSQFPFTLTLVKYSFKFPHHQHCEENNSYPNVQSLDFLHLVSCISSPVAARGLIPASVDIVTTPAVKIMKNEDGQCHQQIATFQKLSKTISKYWSKESWVAVVTKGFW